MKRSILFRVDAVPEIGLGHFYRSFSLAQILKHSFNIEFAMSANSANSCFEILKKAQLSFQSLPDFTYSIPDERGNAEIGFDLHAALNGIDVVVLDGYWFGSGYQHRLRDTGVKVVLIEDSGEGLYHADLIINTAPGLNEADYSTDSLKPLFALGTEYSLLRPGFNKAARLPVSHKDSLGEVLVCFGGADFLNKTFDVVKWFLINTTLKVHAIVGSDYEHEQSLEILSKGFPKLEISSGLDEDQMISSMQRADLGVVPSSGILYECIACRLPVISSAYTENQKKIFFGLKSKKAFFPIEDFSLLELARAFGAITKEFMHQIVTNQVKLVDGNSEGRYQKLFNILC